VKYPGTGQPCVPKWGHRVRRRRKHPLQAALGGGEPALGLGAIYLPSQPAPRPRPLVPAQRPWQPNQHGPSLPALPPYLATPRAPQARSAKPRVRRRKDRQAPLRRAVMQTRGDAGQLVRPGQSPFG